MSLDLLEDPMRRRAAVLLVLGTLVVGGAGAVLVLRSLQRDSSESSRASAAQRSETHAETHGATAPGAAPRAAAAPLPRVLLGEVVAADDGSPVPHTRVQAVLESGAVVTVKSDEQGAFSLEALPAPVVTLRFHADGFRDAVVPRHDLPRVAEAFWAQRLQRTTVEGAALAPDAARLEGTVVDERGAPVTSFRVTAFPVGERGVRQPALEDAFSDPRGRFALDAPPGPLVATVIADGYRPSQRLDVTLRAGQVEQVQVVLAPSVALYGNVTDHDTGAPVAGAQVRLIGPRGVEPAFTDARGSFVLRSLPSENTNLHVSAPGYMELNAAGIDGRRSRDQTLELKLKPVRDGAEAEVVGIGVAVGRTSSGVLIRAIYPGSPALGVLEEGDVITEVDGTATASRALTDNMGAIRGAEGTSVDLVVRGRSGGTRSVRLERRRVAVPKG